MNRNQDITDILAAISAMQKYSNSKEEMLPFLTDLFSFIQGVAPVLGELSSSLNESAQKLPLASDRIEDVSKATEMASNEILDSLDRMTATLESFQKGGEQDTESMDCLHEEIEIIVNALQFQDITSQKLTHANKILVAIKDNYHQFQQLIDQLKGASELGSEFLDGPAEGERSTMHQKQLDEFEEKTKDEVRHSQISQDDIDALFK